MGIVNKTKEKYSVGMPARMAEFEKVKIDDLKKRKEVRMLILDVNESEGSDGSKAVWIAYKEPNNNNKTFATWTGSGGIPDTLLDQDVTEALAVAPLPVVLYTEKSKNGFDVVRIRDDE